MKKSIRSLLCGLGAALLLLTCLPASALAASGGQGEQAQSIPGRQWRREKRDTTVSYYGPEEAGHPQFDRPPVFRPTWRPEGWALDYTWTPSGDHVSSRWEYYKGPARLEFTCYLRCAGYIGMALSDRNSPARMLGEAGPAVELQRAQVQSRDADFYQAGSSAYLIWEDDGGNLFLLCGELDRASMIRMADSVKKVEDQDLPDYRLGWEPEGPKFIRRDVMPGAVILDVQKDMLPEYTNVPFYTFLYASEPLNVPEGTPETVKVKGLEAKYWAGIQKKDRTIPWPSQEEISTLLWTDPQTGISFRIQAPLDRDVLLRMAESVVQAAPGEPPLQSQAPAAEDTQAAAQTNAEREKKLEEAKKIAYQDLSAASKEMQARILAARKLIVSSTSWAADGVTAYTVDENGKKTRLPHFSDLFPGWEMPRA